MPTITMETTETKKYDLQMQKFNDFLNEHMEFIKQITPMNPTIPEDDEWRIDDYSTYDEMRKQENKE